MSKKLICVLVVLALCLSGCAGAGSETEESLLAVYRVESSESGLQFVRETVSAADGADELETLTAALMDRRVDGNVYSAFPEGVAIEGIAVEKGVAKVDMSSEYRELKGSRLLLAESALVLSLCAIDEICSVRIYSGGRLMQSDVNEESISWSDGLCCSYERSAKLFLPDMIGRVLRPRTVLISDDGSVCAPERIMRGLLEEMEGMESADILKCETVAGVCSIDLSHEFYGAEPAESYTGMLMVYSIVNSLCRVPGVESVSLSVDGYPVKSYGGFRTNWPLSPIENLISY